jgi:hypothetical protein
MKAEWTNKDVLTQSETTGQSKSILVIDTPENCAECKLMFLQGVGESICNAVDWSRRPSWCPLRPMPEKKSEVGIYGFDLVKNRYATGWNDCLEELEK